MNKAAFSVFMN